MRRMSFAATVSQMYAQTKTVTRRAADTWVDLEPGDVVMAIEKGMGLPKGERQKCIHPIEIAAVSVVPLLPLTPAEITAEGFPGKPEAEFLADVWEPLHGPVNGSETVRRIEFAHRLDLWTPGYRPSNGTEGEIFRADWCNQCANDHAVHLDPDAVGYPDKPGVCRIFTESLISWPGPGPDEWEKRQIDGQRDRRCTKFEPCECGPGPAFGEFPVEIKDRWRPKQYDHVDGQQTLLA